MARSILIPCGRCAHENLPQNRFCGMCGFPLPSPADTPVQEPQSNSAPKDIHDFLTPVSATETGYNRQARSVSDPSRREPPSTPRFTSRPSLLNLDEPKAPTEPSANTVSGPSFLGLASESDRDRVSYLLEDDQSTSHHGRFVGLILLLFIIALGAAAWHWRAQMGPLAARLSNRSSQPPAQPVDNAGSPISTSPSEVTPTDQTGNTAEKPKTGVGDMPANPPQDQNQAANANNPTATNNAPAVAQNSEQQPAASSPDHQAPAASTPATPAGSEHATDKKDSQAADAEQAMQQQTAKNVIPKNPAKRAASDSTVAPTSSTSLEADGEKYLYGNGVAQDCNRARKSLLAASAQADAKAQSVLGTMYATGHCAPHDLPLAYKWFAKALHADPSNDRLSQDLKVLWNQMTPDERNLALKNQ